jgi:hypothetical protein
VRGAVCAVTSGYLVSSFCDAEVALWGSNQADGDGLSVGTDDKGRGVGRVAAACDIEYLHVDVAEVRDTLSVLDLVNKRLHESDYGDTVCSPLPSLGRF